MARGLDLITEVKLIIKFIIIQIINLSLPKEIREMLMLRKPEKSMKLRVATSQFWPMTPLGDFCEDVPRGKRILSRFPPGSCLLLNAV